MIALSFQLKFLILYFVKSCTLKPSNKATINAFDDMNESDEWETALALL